MRSQWFKIPGPARFLDLVYTELACKSNMIIAVPKNVVHPLAQVIGYLIIERGHLARPVRLDWDDGDKGIDDLLLDILPNDSAFGKNSSICTDKNEPGSAIVASVFRHLGDRLLLVTIRDGDPYPWLSYLEKVFLPQLRENGREPVPTLCLIYNQGWDETGDGVVNGDRSKLFGGLDGVADFCCRSWTGFVGRNDIEALVSSLPNTRDREYANKWFLDLKATLIASIAEDDIDLVEHLLECPWFDLEHSEVALQGYPERLPAKLRNGNGGCHLVEWGRRLWRGQLREIFPIIEEMRIQTITEAIERRLLPESLTNKVDQEIVPITDPFELDFSAFAYHMKDISGSGHELKKRANFLADIRHSLAHRKPVPFYKLTGSRFLAMVDEVMK